MNSAVPTRKVGSGVLSGAIVAIGVWAAKQWGGVEVPAEVAVGATTITTFIVQYFVKDAE